MGHSTANLKCIDVEAMMACSVLSFLDVRSLISQVTKDEISRGIRGLEL